MTRWIIVLFLIAVACFAGSLGRTAHEAIDDHKSVRAQMAEEANMPSRPTRVANK